MSRKVYKIVKRKIYFKINKNVENLRIVMLKEILKDLENCKKPDKDHNLMVF